MQTSIGIPKLYLPSFFSSSRPAYITQFMEKGVKYKWTRLDSEPKEKKNILDMKEAYEQCYVGPYNAW